jgi:hypothetical protein
MMERTAQVQHEAREKRAAGEIWIQSRTLSWKAKHGQNRITQDLQLSVVRENRTRRHRAAKLQPG